jgi:hypothetical protein
MSNDPVTIPIKDFCRLSGISRTQTYRMLDRGMIDSVKIDDMRLIVWGSYLRLIESSRVPPKQRSAAD